MVISNVQYNELSQCELLFLKNQSKNYLKNRFYNKTPTFIQTLRKIFRLVIQIRKVTSALRKKTRLLSFLFSFSVSLFPVIIYEIFTKKILIKFIAGQMAFTFLLYFNHLTSTRNISFYFHSHIIIKKKTVCFFRDDAHKEFFSVFSYIENKT